MMRGRAGFTLIELLVVIILIGVVSAVTFPRLTGLMSGRKLMRVAAEMAAYLDYVRARSVAEKRIYEVKFEPRENRYRATWKGDTMIEEREWRVLPEEVTIKNVDLKERRTGREGPVIRFYPRGNSSGGEILLETERNDEATVLVKSYTGRCRVTREE